jgi:predicted RNase H-like nuclease (RuvC/YqgF family)
MSAEILAIVGTTLAALIAMTSAIYTANQGKKAQVITAERAAEMADRESQRAVQMRMLELLGNEVETLNKRIVELRTRLQSAEDFADMERSKRREVEQRLEELTDSVDRLRNILGSLPHVGEDPEVQKLLKNLNPKEAI